MINIIVNDFTSWRTQARQLLYQGIAPNAIDWQSGQQYSLFGSEQFSATNSLSTQQGINAIQHNTASTTVSTVDVDHKQALTVPASFLQLAQQVACYRDQRQQVSKWALLYRVLWRLQHENHQLMSAPADGDMIKLNAMRKAVNRDMHKMKAFVRFRQTLVTTISPAEATTSSGTVTEIITNANKAPKNILNNTSNNTDVAEYFTAWFEPEHLIVERLAPFFMRRFTGMHWSILTPDCCAHWDQQQLSFTDGVAKPILAEDKMEAFWQTYYCNIFNPARLKEKAMQAEMPKKYWKNLPEAPLIHSLVKQSANKMDGMLINKLTDENHLRRRSKKLRATQDALRQKKLGSVTN